MIFDLSVKEEKLKSVALRRAELIDKAARQRYELTVYAHSLERPLIWAERGWSLMQMLRANPIVISFGVATLVKLITRRRKVESERKTSFWKGLTKWPARIVEAWGVFNQVRGFFPISRR
jgi:hypothetical protein